MHLYYRKTLKFFTVLQAFSNIYRVSAKINSDVPIIFKLNNQNKIKLILVRPAKNIIRKWVCKYFITYVY